MKRQLLNSLHLRVTLLAAILCSAFAGTAFATSYISYKDGSQEQITIIDANNVSSGTAGSVSWTGTSCSYSSSRVNIAANGSITFTAADGYVINKIEITSGSSNQYYGTWTSSPSVSPTSANGVTTFDGLSSKEVTVTTSTAFRCTSKSTIKIYLVSSSSSVATATTTTIDASGITNTDVYTSTAAGALSASVTEKESGNAISGATVTWSSNNETVATINESTGAVTLIAAGTVTFTASYAGNDEYSASSDTYELTVTSSAPYVQPTTVEINMNYQWLGSNNGSNLDKSALPVEKVNDNVTTTITQGTSTQPRGDDDYIRVYKGSTITFKAPDDYNIIKIEFTTGGKDNTWNAPTPDTGSLSDKTWTGEAESVAFTLSGSCFIKKVTITLQEGSVVTSPVITGDESFLNTTEVTITATEGAAIYYTTDGSTPTTSSSKYTEPFTISETTTVKAKATKEGMTDSEVAEKTFTKATVMTVAEAIKAIDDNSTVTGAYVSGIVSQVNGYYNSKYITYWLSSDGATNELEVYNGLGINGAAFTSVDDIQVGDVVVVYGNLKKYNSIYEFDKNNQLVSLIRKEAATITVTGGTEQEIDAANGETELTLAATANSGATVIFTIDEENSTYVLDEDFLFEDNTITLYENRTGVIVVKANAQAAGNYNAAEEVTITVSIIGVKKDAVIVVENSEVAYGSTFTVDDEMIEGGDITVTSSNTAVATVEGLVITPVAVGTTTITVATAENTSYNAGSETFTLTVKAPEGQSTAPTTETFSLTTTFTDKQLNYSEGIKWNASIDANGFETSTPSRGVQFGSGKGEFTLSSSYDNTITKVSLVISTNETSNTIKVAVGGETFYCDDKDVYTLSKDNNYTIEFAGSGSGDIVITVNDQSKSVYFKSITISGERPAAPITTTLNASGYATFCSLYPLDFTNAEDFSAWQITNIDNDNKITFEQVTGAVKGGIGLFLKGEAGATVTIPFADSSNELGDNILEGTLAPMYFDADKIYGLAGNTFKKNSAGTIRANKAYIDAEWITPSVGVKPFTLVFEDDATGIRTIETISAEEAAQIFDLSGRRIGKMQKGVNIVNGRKVLK